MERHVTRGCEDRLEGEVECCKSPDAIMYPASDAINRPKGNNEVAPRYAHARVKAGRAVIEQGRGLSTPRAGGAVGRGWEFAEVGRGRRREGGHERT